MPLQATYPGLYVEEVPSGARTIAGVSTAETAFIDWFPRGPLDRAVRVTSFEDFERVFGGLHTLSEASYAIRQYFLNGGSIAWIVRACAADAVLATLASAIICGSTGFPVPPAPAPVPTGTTLAVSAASRGDWGNRVEIGIRYPATPVPPTTFDIVIREVDVAARRVVNVEIFRSLNMDRAHARFCVDVVNSNSALARLTVAGAGVLLPNATGTQFLDDAGTFGDVLENGVALPGRGNLAFRRLTNGADGTVPQSTNWQTLFGRGAILGEPVVPPAPVPAPPAPPPPPAAPLPPLNRGIRELEFIAPFIFNIMCIPAAAELNAASRNAVYSTATAFCRTRRAFIIVDPEPATSWTIDNFLTWLPVVDGFRDSHAAIYFPRLRIADPLDENRPRDVGPSGTMAGIYARNDGTRGVWNAPAGTDARLIGADVAARLTDAQNGQLNPMGINVLRNFPIFGSIAWGGRTLDGADAQASEWKYIQVRRTALYIEESLFQGLKWVVFQANDEPLWAQIRLNVGAFMHSLFRQGAFQGRSPREAYLVKCDKDTTTQNDIDRGIVNILVGFAPLKPAEFVFIRIQQLVQQTDA